MKDRTDLEADHLNLNDQSRGRITLSRDFNAATLSSWI